MGVLWARAKIDALMDAGRRGAPEAEIRAAVLDVALTHHLVSKYTSLVAVDVTPTRPAGVAGLERGAGQHSRRPHRVRRAAAHRDTRAAAAAVGARALLLAGAPALRSRCVARRCIG